MSTSQRPEQNRASSEIDSAKLQELRVKRASPAPDARDAYMELKLRLQRQLLTTVDADSDVLRQPNARALLQDQLEQLLTSEKIVLRRSEKRELFEAILAEVLGFGPLEPLLVQADVTEIMVNGPRQVFVARNGRVEPTPIYFEDTDHLLRIIRRIVAPLGRSVSPETPIVNVRLPDGTYVNIIMPPVALNGPILTLRRLGETAVSADTLIKNETLSPDALTFLQACVQARLNVIISGGASAGKSSLLSVLSDAIPDSERIITIEDVAELRLPRSHVVTLEAATAAGMSVRALIGNALRMHSDRLIVGELRGSEALDMLQAMNSGSDGGMTTLYANSTRDALNRLENMALMAGANLPTTAIRELIAAAVDIIVHVERLRDGSRRVLAVSEVQAVESDLVRTAEVFRFEQTGVGNGTVNGRLVPTGLRPKGMWKIRDAGITLDPALFGVGTTRTRR